MTEQESCDDELLISSELNFDGDGSQHANQRTLSELKILSPNWSEIETDEDGDLLPPCPRNELTITLERHSRSNLSKVGWQLWQGSLFLADYLLQHPGMVKDKVVLELGAGIGHLTLVASLCKPKSVITTDLPYALPLLQSNLDRNAKLLQAQNVASSISVQELDVTQEFSVQNWIHHQDVDLVLAADLIYDDFLSMSLVERVFDMCKRFPEKTRIFIFAAEKRYCFTLATQSATAVAYDHFLEELRSTMLKNDQMFAYELQVVSRSDVKQSMSYLSSPHLVIVKLIVRWKKREGS